MLVDYKTSFSYMCPMCSTASLGEAGIFAFSGKAPVKLHCSVRTCGAECVSIRKKQSKYTIDIICPICGNTHSYKVSADKFWSGELLRYPCPSAGMEIFFCGNKKEINGLFDETNRQLTEFFDFKTTEDYISDILEILYFMEEEHCISCVCGSENILISPSEDNIALICTDCGRVKLISPSMRTLELIEKAESLIIGN